MGQITALYVIVYSFFKIMLLVNVFIKFIFIDFFFRNIETKKQKI